MLKYVVTVCENSYICIDINQDFFITNQYQQIKYSKYGYEWILLHRQCGIKRAEFQKITGLNKNIQFCDSVKKNLMSV